MKKKSSIRTLIIVFVVFISVSVLAFVLSGFTQPTENGEQTEYTTLYTLDWQMQGAIVASDGTVLENVEVSVSGEILKTNDSAARANLYYTLPDSLGIYYSGLNQPLVSVDDTDSELDYYVFHQYAGYKNDSIFTACGVDTQKEYFIFHWDDGTGRYLIAAMDPTVDTMDIVSHFKSFQEDYNLN